MVRTSHGRRRAGFLAAAAALTVGLAGSALAAGEPAANLGAAENDNGFAILDTRTDYRGPRVAGVGDIVGDGSEDILLGYPLSSGGAGTGVLVKGDKLGLDTIVLDSSPLFEHFVGPGDPGSVLGATVSGAGDINGDGFADFVMGPSSADGGLGIFGNAYVVYGVPAGQSVQTNFAQLAAGVGGFEVRGFTEAGFETSAMDVKGAGDVNGDGFGDLLIHLPQSGPAGNNTVVYVAFGGASMASFNAGAVGASIPGFKINGRGANEIFGGRRGVAPAGDVNGDGLADIVLGLRANNPQILLGVPGEVAVVFGKADNTAVELGDLGDQGFFVTRVGPPGTGLGQAVAGAGDVNADGLSDIIIAEPDTATNTGSAYVVFGRPDTTLVNADEIRSGSSTAGIYLAGDTVTTPSLSFGRTMSVAGAGDVDGDGLADLLVGAPAARNYHHETVYNDAGAAFMVYGKDTADPLDLGAFVGDYPTSPTYGNGARYYYGTVPGQMVGLEVAGLGDITREGLSSYAFTAFETTYVSYPRITPFETFVNVTRPVPDEVTYFSYAKAGDAPLKAVGATDGVQEQYPFSRAWIGFTGGDSASRQAVTLDRTGGAVSGLDTFADPLGVSWFIDGNRTGVQGATLAFHYLDSEVPSAVDGREDLMSVFQGPSASGPWTRLAPLGIDTARNLIVTQAPGYTGYFALGVRRAPPGKAFNPSPFNNQVVTVPDINLTWLDGGGTNTFEVYFGTPGNLQLQGTVDAPKVSFPITGLQPSSQYAWRVDAINEIGTTVGDVWTFRTAACKLPNISEPVPANGVTIPRPPTTLSWTATKTGVYWEGPGCPLDYTVRFGTTNPPTGAVLTAGQTPSVSIAGLAEPGNTYYWQVEATDGVAPQLSSVFSFTVKKPGPADILVLTEFTDAWVSALETGAFQPPVQLGFTGFRHDPLGAWVTRAGDVDGDGALDLITVTQFGEAWTALSTAANAVGPSVKQSGGWHVDPNNGHTVLAGDFNGDGRADLLRVNPGGELIWALNNAGSIPGPSQLQVTTLRHEPDEGFWMMAMDMNNDKRADLVEVNNTEGRIRVALSTGTGFQPAQPIGTWVYRISLEDREALHFGDFNGDDRLDVIQLFDSAMHVGLFNTLTGTFNEPAFIGTVGFHDDSTRGLGWWVFTGDVDQDGLDDLIQINEFGEAWVSNSLGDGTFSTPPVRNAQLGFHHKPNGLWQVFIGKAKD